jgi:hypothetical protein
MVSAFNLTDLAQVCRTLFSAVSMLHQKPGNANSARYRNQGEPDTAMGRIFKDEQLNQFRILGSFQS